MPGVETIAGLGPDRSPERAGELAVAPAAGLAVIGLDHDVRGRCGVGQREQQTREVVDVDQRHTALGRHQHQARAWPSGTAPASPCRRAVDRGRADDRPVEAGAVDQLFGAGLRRRRRATASGSRAASEETWTKRRTPPAVAAASIASVPSTLPRSKAGGVGRVDDAGDVDRRRRRRRPAAASAARSSRSPGDPLDAVAQRLLAAGQRLDLVTGGERDVEQVRADEAGAAGDRRAS